MTLTINGKLCKVENGIGLPVLLTQLGLDQKPVVIEHNETALSPSDFDGQELADGDRLEIITIAAGG
ncbi:MAG: sulfur carrier protein ThiS [Akkermansiaceae bacterium]